MAHDFKRFPELTNSQMQLYYWDSPHKQILEGFPAEVIQVTDGDTIRVKTDFRDFDFPIRLFGIDAPEMKETGLESAKWLADKILGKEIYVNINFKHRVGKFGRLLGEIIHEGQSMNEGSLNERQSIIFGSGESQWA